MANVNKVILMGNLTRDVDLRNLPNGTPVGQFGLAINRKWKDQGGEQREEVTFVDCEAWGKSAEALAKYTAKGAPLFVEGRLKLDSWKDKADGSSRTKLKVVVESFQFIGSKDAGATKAEPSQRPSSKANAYETVREEEIPF